MTSRTRDLARKEDGRIVSPTRALLHARVTIPDSLPGDRPNKSCFFFLSVVSNFRLGVREGVSISPLRHRGGVGMEA